MINLMIVDDHQVLIDGLSALLENAKDIELKHQALSGQSALDILQKDQNIDVVLLDINLPDKDGFTVCQEILKRHKKTQVLALTMHDEPGFISKMVKAGASGYLLKNTDREELIRAIQTVASGEKYYSQVVTNKLLEGMQNGKKKRSSSLIQKITRREKEVLHLIVEEYTTEEIAKKLYISTTTVISHRKSLLRKLNAKNTAGLVKATFEYNLLKEEP